MKDFLLRLFLFIMIPTVIMSVVLIIVPATPRSSSSLLFSKLDKDYLLENTPSPRLILIGGSNLSFGIDSNMLKEELGYSPVNTAIHASIGLDFMTDSVIDYVRPGDILIISPEYSQFYGRYTYGGEELLRTVMDVDRNAIKILNLNQWLNILEFLPKYSFSKIKPSEYFFQRTEKIGIYQRRSFNQYGDVYIHWTLRNEKFEPYPRIEGKFNSRTIEMLLEFEKKIDEKGAVLYLTYPGIQDKTYWILEDQIKLVEEELILAGLNILGTPVRYKMPEVLMYNTPYHLNREGVEYRTSLLIEDLRLIDFSLNE